MKYTTEELEKMYGESRKTTDVMGLGEWSLGEWSLGQKITFKDNTVKELVHIEYRNMAVDLLRFDDGTELFTDKIKDNFK